MIATKVPSFRLLIDRSEFIFDFDLIENLILETYGGCVIVIGFKFITWLCRTEQRSY